MALIDLLQSNSAMLLSVTALLGLLVGSFLNVVIHRLPIMMERGWRGQCEEFLKLETDPLPAQKEPYNLVVPRSRCPKCEHQITALENIPLLSYLFLKGKCSNCGTPISIRYPIIEAVTALLSVLVVWHFGFSWQALWGLVLSWALIALTMIDFDHQLLPDSITLPLLWLGLLLSLFGIFADTNASIIGAAAGYLVLWSIYWAFKLLTGKEGMGFGDFKLLGLLGAWFGWQLLPAIVLLSSFVGAVVGISLILFRGRDRNIPIPFGPYLAAAGWIAMLWGHDLTDAYLRWTGVGITPH